MQQADIDSTPVWLWRMQHATQPVEFGYRVARSPLREDDEDCLYAVVTVNGRVLRSTDGRYHLFTYARRLEQLLALGERIKAQLRNDGYRDVEDA